MDSLNEDESRFNETENTILSDDGENGEDEDAEDEDLKELDFES